MNKGKTSNILGDIDEIDIEIEEYLIEREEEKQNQQIIEAFKQFATHA